MIWFHKILNLGDNHSIKTLDLAKWCTSDINVGSWVSCFQNEATVNKKLQTGSPSTHPLLAQLIQLLEYLTPTATAP